MYYDVFGYDNDEAEQPQLITPVHAAEDYALPMQTPGAPMASRAPTHLSMPPTEGLGAAAQPPAGSASQAAG